MIGGIVIKHKRLDRRGWHGLKHTRYKQSVIDGCVIGLLYYDEVEFSTTWGKKITVIDNGMKWLHILRDNYVITTMFNQSGEIVLWYIDIIGGYGYEDDGVVYFDDLYLDYNVYPDGTYSLFDMDELIEALEQNVINKSLYDTALKTAANLEANVFNDIGTFKNWCIADEYNIDKNRISITGLSMGGFGTWSMGIAFPDYFSALAPVCGGNGMIWLADLLKNIQIRAFHGTADTVVLPSGSIDMVEAVNKAGGKAELTLYEGVGHDSWVQAYEQTDLIEWLMNQVKA